MDGLRNEAAFRAATGCEMNADCGGSRFARSRITLEWLAARHAEEMYALLADERLWELTDGGRPESIEALSAKYARLEGRSSPSGDEHWLNWIVRDAGSGVPLGFVQATIPKDGDTASIAYVIGRRFWRQGFAGEAVRLMIDEIQIAFAVANLKASVDSRNVASIALLKRLGLRCLDRSDSDNQEYGGPIAR